MTVCVSLNSGYYTFYNLSSVRLNSISSGSWNTLLFMCKVTRATNWHCKAGRSLGQTLPWPVGSALKPTPTGARARESIVNNRACLLFWVDWCCFGSVFSPRVNSCLVWSLSSANPFQRHCLFFYFNPSRVARVGVYFWHCLFFLILTPIVSNDLAFIF